MPLTAYLKIGDIAGESQRVDHEEEIDIHGMAWDIEHVRGRSVGRGRARARAEVGPLVLQKYYDAASPYLASAVDRGKSFDEAVLSVRKDSGEAHLDYLVITMSNVVVSSYDVSSLDDEMQLTETVELECEKITFKYTVQAEDHSAGDEHEVEIRV